MCRDSFIRSLLSFILLQNLIIKHTCTKYVILDLGILVFSFVWSIAYAQSFNVHRLLEQFHHWLLGLSGVKKTYIFIYFSWSSKTIH